MSGGGGSKTKYDWGAANKMAAISRADWVDYQNRFVPIENQVLNYAQNPNTDYGEVGAAVGNAQAAVRVGSGIASRTAGRYGVGMDADTREAIGRADALASGAAGVDAAAYTTNHQTERKLGLMGSGISTNYDIRTTLGDSK